jgi:hypothetical protein
MDSGKGSLCDLYITNTCNLSPYYQMPLAVDILDHVDPLAGSQKSGKNHLTFRRMLTP